MRCVIADDSNVFRPRLERILRTLGHDVVASVENGAQAVVQCAALRPDLVVLDKTMPGGDGDAAIHAILDAGTARYAIIASNQGNDAVLAPLRVRGVVFCGKPYETHKVATAIERVTGAAGDGAR